MRFGFVSMLLAALAALGTAQSGTRFRDMTFSKSKVEKDIVYKRAKAWDGKEIDLKLDLYTPEGDTQKNRPAIVFVHGGYLAIGSKDGGWEGQFAEKFARRGYVTISINYRLRPDPNPTFNDAMMDAMTDTMDAFLWLRSRATTYNLDPKKIALAGYSAGGEIITNLCYTPYVKAMDPKQVFAVVDVAGNTLFWGDPVKGAPPCLIVHGTADDVNPFSASENLRDRLKKAEVPVELAAMQKADHYFRIPGANLDTVEDTIARYLFELLQMKS